jgi:cytochrome c556
MLSQRTRFDMRRMGTSSFVSTMGALIALLSLVSACAGTSGKRGEEGGALPGDKQVEHAVQSAALRSAMYEIERLTLQQIPEDIDAVNTKAARTADVQRHAQALAHAAVALPSAAGGLGASDRDTPRFYELADQLRRDALSLRDRAAVGQLASAGEESDRLLVSCNACHAEFRLPPPAPPAPVR